MSSPKTSGTVGNFVVAAAWSYEALPTLPVAVLIRDAMLWFGRRHHDRHAAQWHRRYGILGYDQDERRLHPVCVVSSLRKPAPRNHGTTLQLKNFLDSDWKAG